jgi:small subunit ribosomal protein S18
MARNPKVMKKKSTDRRPKPAAAGGGRPRRGRPKFCVFCREQATWVDYKDVGVLKRFINDRGRIRARGATGTCAQHQRDVATAVKTARELALLPYVVRTVGTESRGGRGGDRRANTGPAPAEDVSAPDRSGPSPAAVGGRDGTEGTAPDEVTDGSVAATV